MHTRLAAVANVRLPTEKAHGIQIMAMYGAFATQRCDVTLVVPTRRNPLTVDLFVHHGAPETLRIPRVATLDLLPRERIAALLDAATRP